MRSLARIFQLPFELALLGGALVCLAGSAGAQYGRWNERYDLLSHLALVWLAGGVFILAFTLAHRPGLRKMSVLVAAGVSVAFAAELMAPEFLRPMSPRAPPDAPCQVKVISFNAWGENADPDVVARWVAREHPDVALIVEGSKLLKTRMEEVTGLQTWMGESALVVSRVPYTVRRTSYSTRDMPGKGASMTWDMINLLPDTPVHVVSAHPGWPRPTRYARARDVRIAAVLDQEDRASAILVGDFNSAGWSFRHRAADKLFGLERRDRAIMTWPARVPFGRKFDFPIPFMPIDHVYAGSNWRTVKVERGPRLGSDHYPLIMTLAWNGPLRSERLKALCVHQ